MNVGTVFQRLWLETGLSQLTLGNVVMLGIGILLLYLAIYKKFEPLLLVPIAFGAILANLPLAPIMNPPQGDMPGGLLYYLSFGVEKEIFPPLIFLGVGAMTDFGPLLANPWTILLGAAAQIGVFLAMLMAKALGFTLPQPVPSGLSEALTGPLRSTRL